MADERQGGTLRADQTPGPAESAGREPLTQARIVTAAIALVEREGPQAVSMRRIGAELGVAAMSLYNHVPSKEAVLDGVADRILSGLEDADPVDGDWQSRTRALAFAFRASAHRYPRCVMLVLERTMNWTRALAPIEHMLRVAHAAGFHGPPATQIMRTVMSYVVGALMREAETARTLKTVEEESQDLAKLVDLARYPHVVEHSRQLLHPDYDADFAFGLELLIQAIDRLPRTPTG